KEGDERRYWAFSSTRWKRKKYFCWGDWVVQEDVGTSAVNIEVPRPVCCPKAKKGKVSPPTFWDMDFDSLG
ncbi:hypothetical protein A2U01_0101761, partial [Trifolium medium]|nr:hypothetical protein [Trifolium medium]